MIYNDDSLCTDCGEDENGYCGECMAPLCADCCRDNNNLCEDCEVENGYFCD